MMLQVKASIALQVLAVAIAYIATARFAISFAVMQSGIVVFWMPNAIVLVALFLSRREHWWKFCTAAFGAELLVDSIGGTFHIWQALGFGLINVAEAIFAAVLLRRYCGHKLIFSRLREVLIFAAVTMGVAPAFAALGGAWIFALSDVNQNTFWVDWRIWWAGDGMGMISMAPLLLGWVQKPQIAFSRLPSRPLHGLVLTLLTIGLCGVLFLSEPTAKSLLIFSPILLLPLTFWAAMAYGVRGATLLGCVVSVCATLGSAQDRGLFSSLPGDIKTVILQQFLASLLLTGLAIAAVLTDLRIKYLGKRLFKVAVEHMHEGMTISDATLPDQPIVYANPKFMELTGYTEEEVLGQNCRFLNARNADQPQIAAIRAAIAQQDAVQCTVRNSKKDGTLFWNLLTISPIKNEHGKVTHFIGIQRDVTKAIETENQLLEANAQLLEMNQALEARVAERTADLERLATTDSLTGVFNRRFWISRAQIEVASANRQHTSLSVVMLDIDNFKRINDIYGHPTGDLVLVKICESVQGILRPGDTFARLGGEEFVLLLTQTDKAMAIQVADRIRTLVSSLDLTAVNQTNFGVTASFGVATLNNVCNDVEALLSESDSALYRAKEAGRNCVVAASLES